MNEFFNNKVFIGKSLIWGYKTILFTHYTYGYNMITSVVFSPGFPIVKISVFPDNHFSIDKLSNYSKLRKLILTGVYSGSSENTKLISVHADPWLINMRYDLESINNSTYGSKIYTSESHRVMDDYKDNVNWLFNKYMLDEEV